MVDRAIGGWLAACLATIAELIQTHGEYAVPARERTVRVRALEHGLADLVNRAYRLTAEEIDLLWRTAPPRMPRY